MLRETQRRLLVPARTGAKEGEGGQNRHEGGLGGHCAHVREKWGRIMAVCGAPRGSNGVREEEEKGKEEEEERGG